MKIINKWKDQLKSLKKVYKKILIKEMDCILFLKFDTNNNIFNYFYNYI